MESGRNGDQFAQLAHLIQVPAETKLHTDFNSHTSPAIQSNFQLFFGQVTPSKHTSYDEYGEKRFYNKSSLRLGEQKQTEQICICCNLPVSETFKKMNSQVTNSTYGRYV
eukprot:TRINITY_DN3033_c0_g1_i1.p1 TRINITY_DN3033_c0_g1~~TRINITY_DN3033_c0_g1_i1.p1  ORF type:complete len:129 (+),score=19.15 TRINITY_DN3033_c0_g1_i1:60-389(+)